MSKWLLDGLSFVWLQVLMLLALQVTASVVLWFLNPITQAQTDTFALFLSVDLLGFVILSYQYRAHRYGWTPNILWLAVSYFVLVLLLASDLVLY